jgi:hypothetical protein
MGAASALTSQILQSQRGNGAARCRAYSKPLYHNKTSLQTKLLTYETNPTLDAFDLHGCLGGG